jgi:hypothetical protein
LSIHEHSIGIALPVREWSEYAEEAIKSFISFARPIDKLLVSIDGSESQKEQFSKIADADDRISVVQTSESLSMAGHYEWCLTHLATDWISVLGQDDALQFNFRQVTSTAIDFATVHGLDAISFKRAYFNWNDGTSELLGYGVKYAPGSRPRRIRSKKQITLGLLGLVEHFDFPQIYTNNLVRRRVVDEIRATQSGLVFLEPIPDTYSGVAVACRLGSYLRWPVPAFWTGTSSKSAGLMVSSTNSDPPHILLANLEGRHFGVSQQFWLQSENSSVFILSALQSMKSQRVSNEKISSMTIAAAASVLSSQVLRGLRKSIARRFRTWWPLDSRTNSPLVGLSMVMAFLLALVLLPLQITAHALRYLQFKFRLGRPNSFRVMETDLILSPNAANEILARKWELTSNR